LSLYPPVTLDVVRQLSPVPSAIEPLSGTLKGAKTQVPRCTGDFDTLQCQNSATRLSLKVDVNGAVPFFKLGLALLGF